MVLMTIIGLEGGVNGATVHAQFNPKEISIDRAVNWRQQPKQSPADLEYVGSEPKTMSFELMFDGFESGTPVQPAVEILQRFSEVDSTLKRPPKIRVMCGSQPGDDAAFRRRDRGAFGALSPDRSQRRRPAGDRPTAAQASRRSQGRSASPVGSSRPTAGSHSMCRRTRTGAPGTPRCC